MAELPSVSDGKLGRFAGSVRAPGRKSEEASVGAARALAVMLDHAAADHEAVGGVGRRTVHVALIDIAAGLTDEEFG